MKARKTNNKINIITIYSQKGLRPRSSFGKEKKKKSKRENDGPLAR